MSAIPVPDPELRRQRIILQGDVPSPVNPPRGCHFHPRCPEAMGVCARLEPPLIQVGEGHFAACHRRDPGFADRDDLPGADLRPGAAVQPAAPTATGDRRLAPARAYRAGGPGCADGPDPAEADGTDVVVDPAAAGAIDPAAGGAGRHAAARGCDRRGRRSRHRRPGLRRRDPGRRTGDKFGHRRVRDLLGPVTRDAVALADVAERRIVGHAVLGVAQPLAQPAAGVEPAARRRIRRRRYVSRQHEPLLADAAGPGSAPPRQERDRVGVTRLLVELDHVGQLDELAEVHHADAIADVLDHRQVVRDEQVRQAELVAQVDRAG